MAMTTAKRSAPAASGRVPARPGKAERTRLRLVEAVRDELQAAGVCSAEAVARRAESSPATFYNHFQSKDDAILAAFDAAMHDLVAFVDRRLDVSDALELGRTAFLRDWIESCVAFFRANSLVFSAARTQLANADGFRAIYRAREAEALAHYTRFVRLAQRAGLVRAGDPDALAEVFMLTSEGWNHPRVLRMERGDALHAELVRSVEAMLAPDGALAAARGGDPA